MKIKTGLCIVLVAGAFIFNRYNPETNTFEEIE